MSVVKISADTRTIKSIHTMALEKGADGWGGDGPVLQHVVGSGGVTSIEAYQESNGPWFIIRQKAGGKETYGRVNSAFVAEVEYAQ